LTRTIDLKKTPKNGLFRRQILVSPQFGIVDQTPLCGQKVADGPFDRIFPARSWEMPLERDLPAKLGNNTFF